MGKSMPMAVVFGTEPAFLLAAAAKVKHPPDEFVYTSSLRRDPLELVKCETVDLEVPATSEIVLEGEVLPYERKPCGPFGEYTGHYSGIQHTPIFKVKAITHRNNAIFQATREGKPPQESAIQWVLGKHYEFHRNMMQVPGVKDAAMVLHSAGHHGVVALEKLYPGHPFQICMHIWGDPDFGVHFKQIVVVDPDVNIYDPRDVEWAIATRCQADRDVLIVPNLPGIGLDVSQPMSRRRWGSKMGIDATRPTYEYEAEGLAAPETCQDPHIVEKVRAQWSKYGSDLAGW